jgi:hypothetical protein
MFGHTVNIVSIYGEIYSHSFVRVTRKDNGGAWKSLMDGEFRRLPQESYEGSTTKVPEKLLE